MLQIRNKRLAKLANSTPTASSTDGPSDSPTSSNPSPSRSPAPAPQQVPEQQSTPASATPTTQSPEGKRIKISPATPVPERHHSTTSSTGTPPPAKTESIEAFEDRTLGAVFRLTLKEEAKRDIHGQRVYLPGLRKELQDEGQELRIQASVLDQALLEAASKAERQRPLDYLLPCWKRITKLHKGFRRATDEDPKYRVLCEARRLCMSYCVFAITMPEMFGYVCSYIPENGWVQQTYVVIKARFSRTISTGSVSTAGPRG